LQNQAQDQETIMADNSFGEIIQPIHCRASASGDKTKFALTFTCQDRAPITVVLPVAGAAGLQRNLAQALYVLTGKPPSAAEVAVLEPVAAE
jgi:hypothetical protein